MNQVYWCMPMISAVRRLKQDFKLVHMTRLRLAWTACKAICCLKNWYVLIYKYPQQNTNTHREAVLYNTVYYCTLLSARKQFSLSMTIDLCSSRSGYKYTIVKFKLYFKVFKICFNFSLIKKKYSYWKKKEIFVVYSQNKLGYHQKNKIIAYYFVPR